MQSLRKLARRGGQGTHVVVATVLLAVLVAPLALASGEGSNARLGARNPAGGGELTRETEIIAQSSTYGTRQSNKTAGDGGGAIYGCRSAPGREPCVRASNLTNGRAFELHSVNGTEVGQISVGNGTTPNPNARPFTTNANGVATGLNADQVDGKSASELTPLRADVSGDGTLQRGTAGTTVTRPGAGDYRVVFAQDVSTCTPVATVGSPGTGNAARAFIDVAFVSGNANAIAVDIEDEGGEVNRPFHLIVVC